MALDPKRALTTQAVDAILEQRRRFLARVTAVAAGISGIAACGGGAANEGDTTQPAAGVVPSPAPAPEAVPTPAPIAPPVPAPAPAPAPPQLGPMPMPGTFSNVSLNTLKSVAPAGWPSNDSGGPFANWGGGVFAADFGSGGGYAVYGSGHLGANAPLWAGISVFDLATRTWSLRAAPASPIVEPASGTAGYNAYFESTATATLGHPYPPHTYGGLVYQRRSLGGGSHGSLIRNCFAGSPNQFSRAVHRFDLSTINTPPTRVLDGLAIASSYPMAAIDESRGGYWALQNNGNGPVVFVRFSDWAQLPQPSNSGYNAYGDQFFVYVPSRDCLVAFGRDGQGGANWAVRVSAIVNGVPQAWAVVTPTGTPPADRRCGGVWSGRLGKIVCYEAAGSHRVHKLSLPDGSLTGTGWSWSAQTFTGNNGAVPSRNAVADNGAWGRFVEVPDLGVFVWCDGIDSPVQFWNVT